jgi:hypothetical protein
MDFSDLDHILRSLGYALPELIVLTIGFALLMEQRKHHTALRLGLIGVVVMFVVTLLRTGLSLAQTVMFARGDVLGDLDKAIQLFSSAMILLNIVFCAGLLAVIVALRNATRRMPEHTRLHQPDNPQA